MAELRRNGMDLPPPPKQEEFPKRELGVRVEATFQHKTGIRRLSNQSSLDPSTAPSNHGKMVSPSNHGLLSPGVGRCPNKGVFLVCSS